MPSPVSLRLPDDDLAIIDSAARRQGRSRTDFMRAAAVQAAEAVLLESTIIRMSAGGFAAFMAEIDKPGEPIPEMVEKLRRAQRRAAEG
ncbi:DUF1778 domain-containing protein [Phenylobacterium sp.]|uniref:type II toxin-antitoxin system TacA family antitoxin n=1 Tax=Phenylobacterium sp. TaxID=1871053 RepID=UPI0025E28E39|nr:DUF1778 domain-containing protein [Phenylobacterium sp.]MBX3484929.1 DUF1778 domain-containing protein [Phenylobacterium sp.]MCW5759828.1 DUF1778 domain-containing protein [Phenylobacterium sp.]